LHEAQAAHVRIAVPLALAKAVAVTAMTIAGMLLVLAMRPTGRRSLRPGFFSTLLARARRPW
jgi:hypothetical protein